MVVPGLRLSAVNRNMDECPRITATFSVSLPPEMAVELEEVMKQEHRTRSELVREALRQYFRDRGSSDGRPQNLTLPGLSI